MSRCKSNASRLFWALYFLFILQSCIPYQSIDFQILKPAQVKLGPNIKDVAIHCGYCSDTTSFLFMDSLQRLKARTSINFLYTLRENLGKSPLFKGTKIQFFSEYKRDNSFSPDLIISLDSIFLKDTLMVEQVKYASYSMFTYGVIHRFGCKVFDTKNNMVIANYLLKDTAFWPPLYTAEPVTAEWKDLVDSYWDTGIKAGERYARYLAPYWIDQTRLFYYGNNKTFKKAYKEIQNDNLDSAFNILNKVNAKKINITQKAKLLHNLAIVKELQGDIDNAVVLADSSYYIKKNKFEKPFQESLRIRKIDQLALDWQFAN